MPSLYPGILPFFSDVSTSAGYTQRFLAVSGTNVTGQRSPQLYMRGVQMIAPNDMWLHPLSDAQVRQENAGTAFFQVFHVYTVSLSSPDGDLPYKKGDIFIPNGNLVGLVANTAHPIAGVQQFPNYCELILQRKL